MRAITVGIFVDPYSSMMDDELGDRQGISGRELEYREIEKLVKGALPGREIAFVRDLQPWSLANQPCDLYILDIGGMCRVDFSGKLRGDTASQFLRYVDERPSTFFVPYSVMTRESVRSEVCAMIERELGLNEDEDPAIFPVNGRRPNLWCPDKNTDLADGWSSTTDMIKIAIAKWFECH